MDNSIQAHQKELCNKLWAMANALRGNMEAYEFKNYILGMIFYYYLSDRTEKYMANLLKDDGIGYEEAWADEEYKTAVIEEALRDLGYVIEPQYLFRKMVKMVESRSFDIEFLQSAINALMESTEVLLWQRSSLRWTKSTSAWMTPKLMFLVTPMNI